MDEASQGAVSQQYSLHLIQKPLQLPASRQLYFFEFWQIQRGNTVWKIILRGNKPYAESYTMG